MPNYLGLVPDWTGTDRRNRRGPRAGEHFGRRQSISAISVGIGRADSLGLEALTGL